MKKIELESLGLEKDVIDRIFEIHNADIEREKGKARTEIENADQKRKAVENENSELKTELQAQVRKSKELEELETRQSEIITELETIKKEYSDHKSNSAAEIDNLNKEKDNAIDTLSTKYSIRNNLRRKGIRDDDESIVEYIQDKYFNDFSEFKKEDGEITNFDDVFEQKKSKFSGFIPVTKQEGAEPASPKTKATQADVDPFLSGYKSVYEK